MGDELLKAVAHRLSSTLGASDQLARLSGDEFTILQTSFRHAGDAAALAERCIEKLAAPFEIAGNEITVGVSVGIVCCAHYVEHDTVLQQADLALYKAKREGRNCYRIYERGMNDPLRLRNELEDELRRSLSADELEVHYQPIIDARTGQTTAMEALLRWTHPKRGPISPAEFIPIAEERGLMPELGAWVLERACRDATRWPAHIRLNLNVSPAQLLYEDFTRVLMRSLSVSGLPAGRLELEITETALLESSGTPHRDTKEAANAYAPHFAADFNGRFGKTPRSPFDAHRPLRADESLDLILTSRVPRRVTKTLTVQYDRVIYMLEDTSENRALIHQYLDVFEYPDGRIEIRVNGTGLAYRQYDRLSEIDQGAVIDNKRLRHALQVAQVLQAQRDDRCASGMPSRTNQGLAPRPKERKVWRVKSSPSMAG